jgi:hypothetical protein
MPPFHNIITQTLSISTTGSAGSATGTGTTMPVNGFLLDACLNYHASAPATTDVTISDAVFGTILTKSNNNSDVWITPRVQTQDNAGADTGAYDYYPVNGALTVSIAQADALTDCLVITLRFLTV